MHMVQLTSLSPHYLLLDYNPEWFYLSDAAYPGCPGNEAIKWVLLLLLVVAINS